MSAHPFPCVVHVHSTYSDGTATVPEIIAAARESGARGVLLTDHNTLEARRDGWQGWHDGVLLVVGHEVTPPDLGHLLAFGLDAEVPDKGRTEQEICADVVARGGIGFAAHPFSLGSRMSRRVGRPHPWRALESCPRLGVELWSLTTDTAEAWSSPRQAWRELRRPEALLDAPPPRHLALWDALGKRRRVRSPMPHARWFGLLQTLVLLEEEVSGDAGRDVPALVDALGRGRALLARPLLGDARGFSFGARGADGPLAPGDEAADAPRELVVESPLEADLVLLRDGAVLAHAPASRELRAPTRGPGVYRAEARRGGRTWVLTNPVYLR